MKIEEKIIEDERLALINYNGAVEDLVTLINDVKNWLEKEKIEIIGSPIAIYYSKIREDNTAVYDVGYQITADTQGTRRIVIGEMPGHDVVSIIHEGNIKDIKKSYDLLVNYVNKNNYDIIGSPKEIYLNLLDGVPDNELKTEIQFPVIK